MTSDAPTTLVLVHGAWHGPWCWNRLIPRLDGMGLRIVAPSLTGMGDRAAELDPGITVETHAADIVRTIADARGEVILVGHSYAGIVVTVAAARMPARVRQIIYADAFVPEPGRSLFDLLPDDDRVHMAARAAELGDGWRLPAMPPAFYGVDNPADAAIVAPLLCDWNLGCQQSVAEFVATDIATIPTAYIAAYGDGGQGRFSRFAALFSSSDPRRQLYRIRAGHDFFFTHPDEAARLFKTAIAASVSSNQVS